MPRVIPVACASTYEIPLTKYAVGLEDERVKLLSEYEIPLSLTFTSIPSEPCPAFTDSVLVVPPVGASWFIL